MTNEGDVIHVHGGQGGNACTGILLWRVNELNSPPVLRAKAAVLQCLRGWRQTSAGHIGALRAWRGFPPSPGWKTGKYDGVKNEAQWRNCLQMRSKEKANLIQGFWSKIHTYPKCGYPEYEKRSPQDFKGSQWSLLVHYFKSKLSFYKLPNYSPDPHSRKHEYILTFLTR